MRKAKSILALCLGLLALDTRTGAAADFCVSFPLGVGPEEVCATGVFPDGPIHVGPGDAVARPLVEYVNGTNRPMTFTIEVIASAAAGSSHSVTLAPGESASFTHVQLLETDDLAP